MSGTIQGGTAEILTHTGPALQLRYTNSQTLSIACRTHAVYISYSEAGLQSDASRFKLQKINDASAEGPDGMTLTFNTPSSGTLFFASANAGASATVYMWSIECGKTKSY
tara:strand:- start:814 stop:1143 length:330 start_codon:yes stop_codon:yes gene_type:complete